MRMWNIPPEKLCQKHLCGEHLEMHMFVGTIKRGNRIDGYVRNKLVDTRNIQRRHDELAAEMLRRGYNHKSPMDYEDMLSQGEIDVEFNRADLMARCPECRARLTP